MFWLKVVTFAMSFFIFYFIINKLFPVIFTGHKLLIYEILDIDFD